MGPREPKNDIQYHLHKTYWGLPRKFFEKHWGLHFSLWGLQLKILVRNSIRDSIFWGLHSKYFGDSTWDSIGDSHWGLQWSPKWSPPQKKARIQTRSFFTGDFYREFCFTRNFFAGDFYRGFLLKIPGKTKKVIFLRSEPKR